MFPIMVMMPYMYIVLNSNNLKISFIYILNFILRSIVEETRVVIF